MTMTEYTIEDLTFHEGDQLVGGGRDALMTIASIERGHPRLDDYDDAVWLLLESPDGRTTWALAGSIAPAVTGDWSTTNLRRADDVD